MKDKVLFIGGSGLLALNWANQIKEEYQVHLALHSRLIEFDGVLTVKLYTHIKYGLTEYLKANQIDIVVNCAGRTSVEECEKNPDLAHDVNTIIPINTARVCKEMNIKFIHISTDHLFSGDSAYASEEQIPTPLNIYGKTKLDGEVGVARVNEEAIIIRTNFYGWGTSYRSSFSDFVIQSLRNGNSISLFHDVYYTPILIDQLVVMIHSLLEINAFGVYNVCGNERITKLDFGQKLAIKFGLDLSLIKGINFSDKRNLVQRPIDMSLSNHKLLTALGKSMTSLDKQLSRLFAQESSSRNKKIIEL